MATFWPVSYTHQMCIRDRAAEAAGNKYVICRSVDDFRKEVISYLFPKK